MERCCPVAAILVDVVAVVAVTVVAVSVVVVGHVGHDMHITGQVNVACLPMKLLRAQSVTVYVVPQSDGSGSPQHSAVVVVVEVVTVVDVVE